MTGRRNRMHRIGVAVIVSLAGAVRAAQAGAVEAAQARAILDAAGVRGGLVVHIGRQADSTGSRQAGYLTAALRAGASYLVHGLDTDAAKVAAARANIQAAGLYGPVSVDRWDGKHLPYADNAVNLIVDDSPGMPMAEAMRVLAPLGVLMVKGADGQYARTVKPRPKDIDEWPQYLYDAGNNAVSHDEAVGPPRCLQWIGGPMWARHHDHMASMSALVSAGGRIFYIMDEGPKESILLPSRWSVIARDAFSGVILWKVPIETWVTQLWPLKSGPNQVPRKLITDGSRVYVTLGLDAPVSVLDAATGKTLATWEQTKEAEEMILSDGTVFVQSTKSANPWNEFSPKATNIWSNCRPSVGQWDKEPRTLQAIDVATGKTLWKRDATIAPLTLTADAKRVYYYDGNCIRAIGRPNGADVWHSADVPCAKSLSPAYGPTLVAVDGVLLLSPDRPKMYGFDAATGKTLWSSPHIPAGHQSPDDTLVIGGNVWCAWKDNAVARDIHTGQIKKQAPADAKAYWFHHRCHRAKATENYFMLSMTGIEFIDTDTGHWVNNNWIRGGCLYGIMPANGLVYAPPSACGCYLESKQFGFNAVSAAQPYLNELAKVGDAGRLEKGPAYGAAPAAGMAATQDQDWPTYRHDTQRSGASPAPVAAGVKIKWQRALGGHLTSPTIAGGRVYVAEEDAHTVAALEADTGAVAWKFTAGGRVDSPPTIAGGMAIFGSADGWIYAVRASDGQLAWRFRAAPIDRRIVAFEQLESAWPVSGAVLVRDAQVYAVAGRSAFLDGGLRLLRLDAATGKKLSETVVDYGDPAKNAEVEAETKNCTDMRVALPDVLSCDGKNVYMRAQEFDLEGKLGRTTPLRADDQVGPDAHLFSRSGFLDDTWFSRSYWMYGRGVEGMPGHPAGFEQWPEPAWYCPSGRLLVFNADTVYGFGRKPQFQLNSAAYQYRFFATARNMTEQAYKAAIEKMRKKGAGASWSDWQVRAKLEQSQLSTASCAWSLDDPAFRARGMVLAGPMVFAAGPPATLDEVRAFRSLDDPATKKALSEQAQSLAGKRGATLAAFSAGDGKKLAEIKLDAPPVWDGLAAANGKLFMATADGKVICLAP